MDETPQQQQPVDGELLDLNDLRVFAYVASLSSFSLAAEALGIHKSSVSRSIIRLEALFQTSLLNRSTRKVQLTARGAALQERCTDILNRISDSIGHVGSLAAPPQGHLVVAVSESAGLATRIQRRLLPHWVELFPDVRLTLRFTRHKAELKSEDIDIAVSLGASTHPTRTQLGVVERRLCASPIYLQRMGIPVRPEDLHQHSFVVDDGNEADSFVDSILEPLFSTVLLPRSSANEPSAVRDLVLAGAGIGCLLGPLCDEDVEAGRLVRLLHDMRIPSLAATVAFPSRKQLAPAVTAFVDLLKSVL
ncbi:LysR family transcriptional regulator [Variovorax sp. J22R24]|uniref:LysR family transcriptional regulator n=1 Tax=Variovorax gracilis TaxID=3053502 RepID=UPI0025756580|nr:LysR family transcriptional regulator [Variovorax sp. J22R24]MDM0108440.1 LysR family transcriptional regulator [Variovorax sp. J22R24]